MQIKSSQKQKVHCNRNGKLQQWGVEGGLFTNEALLHGNRLIFFQQTCASPHKIYDCFNFGWTPEPEEKKKVVMGLLQTIPVTPSRLRHQMTSKLRRNKLSGFCANSNRHSLLRSGLWIAKCAIVIPCTWVLSEGMQAHVKVSESMHACIPLQAFV